MVLAGCGSASGGQTGTSTTSSKTPLTIGIGLALQGEDQYAVNSYYYGIELAISQLNKAGGVNGHPIQSFRVSTPSDPTGMASALLQIGAKKPDVIIGFDNPAVASLTRQVDEVGIPIIAPVQMALINGLPGGSKWLFQEFSSNANLAQAPVNFAKGTLHAKTVAVMHTNESFGIQGSALITQNLQAAGIKESANVAYSPTATDMSQPVLAAQGSDAVINWGYPGPLAAQVNLMAQNGNSEPTIGPLSVATDVASGAIHSSSFGKVYAAGYCNPTGSTQANSVAFVKAYTARFGTAPDENGALSYDSVLVAVAAARQAKSFAPADMRAALQAVHVTNGLCSNNYHADATQVLLHEVTMLGFNPSGQPITKAVYNFPPAQNGN
ncbi:MAG TPA: ABC transporter substrate-binding protein [Trebonia sp.]